MKPLSARLPRQTPTVTGAPDVTTPTTPTAPQAPASLTVSTFTPAPATPAPPKFTHPAFSQLTADQRAAVEQLHEGASVRSVRFRQALANAPPATTAEEQLAQLNNALAAATPNTVEPEVKSHLATPPEFQLSPPRTGDWNFRGTTAPAELFDLTIDGRTITLARPADGKYSGVQHSLDEVVRTLTTLPAVSRALVTSVTLSPMANPDDAFWAQTYGVAEAKSYMTCGAQGTIDIYPADTAVSLDVMRTSIIHETGHAWSMKRWNETGDSPEWQAWADAANGDVLPVSHYGSSNLFEDVAEATAMYLEARGSPAFEQYRVLFPRRFAILDRELGGAP